MVFPAVFAIAVGALMIAQWAFFLLSGNVPELKTEPIRTWGHIAAEMATAAALIASGIGLWVGAVWALPLALFALGMLMYTLIVSPMYFVQKRVWPIVGMFAVVFALALVSLRQVFAAALAG